MMTVVLKPGDPTQLSASKALFHSRVPVSDVHDRFAVAEKGEWFMILECSRQPSSFFNGVVDWSETARNAYRRVGQLELVRETLNRMELLKQREKR
jgi:hypothetical protein